MGYEVQKSHDCEFDYLASAVGEDGEIYVAVFSGPEAQARAREYVAWKNGE